MQSVRPSWIGLRSIVDPRYGLNSAQLVKVPAAPRSLREAGGHSRGVSIPGLRSDLLALPASRLGGELRLALPAMH